MESYKLGFKIFLADGLELDSEGVVPVFHGWIQRAAVFDHMLIDVADYGHVPNGPGVVLVAHEANYSIDGANGRVGLLYTRKQPCGRTFEARFQACLKATLEACQLLQEEKTISPAVRFNAREIVFRIYDRLLAPNTPATFAEIKPIMQSVLLQVYGAPVELQQTASADKVFEVVISSSRPAEITALLNRLARTT